MKPRKYNREFPLNSIIKQETAELTEAEDYGEPVWMSMLPADGSVPAKGTRGHTGGYDAFRRSLKGGDEKVVRLTSRPGREGFPVSLV